MTKLSKEWFCIWCHNIQPFLTGKCVKCNSQLIEMKPGWVVKS